MATNLINSVDPGLMDQLAAKVVTALNTQSGVARLGAAPAGPVSPTALAPTGTTAAALGAGDGSLTGDLAVEFTYNDVPYQLAFAPPTKDAPAFVFALSSGTAPNLVHIAGFSYEPTSHSWQVIATVPTGAGIKLGPVTLTKLQLGLGMGTNIQPVFPS
jgi:hypothetical protein